MAKRYKQSKASRGNPSRQNNVLTLAAAVIAVLFVIGFFVFGAKDISQKTRLAERALDGALSKTDIRRDSLVRSRSEKMTAGKVKFDYVIKEYKINGKFSIDNFERIVQQNAQKEGLWASNPEYFYGKDFKLAKFDLYWQRYKLYTLRLRQGVVEKQLLAEKPKEQVVEKPKEKIVEKAPEKVVEKVMKPAEKIEKPKLAPEVKKPEVVKPKPVIAKVAPPKKQKRKTTGKLAIVLDDWGYSENNIDTLIEISRPVTLAVLPHLPYTKDVAIEAHRKGFELMLHLPLQAYGGQNAVEEGTILIDMDEKKILELLNSAIDDVPYIKGVSNHQGSKATADEATMTVILKQLRRKGFFFLDSYSSNKSACKDAAKKTRVKFAQRNIFLDNEENYELIKENLYKAYGQAVEKGSCIAIGHDRPVTLKVLKDVMPELEQKGIKFVSVSELAR